MYASRCVGYSGLYGFLLGLYAYKIPLDSDIGESRYIFINLSLQQQPQGVFVCVLGLGLLVASDMLTDKNWVPVARGKGDGFMVAGATLYGFTNATEEFFVRKRPLYEVVGSLGMFGFIISAIQASGLEHMGMREATWSGFNGENYSSS
jgi:hypothetical protein